MEKKRSCPNNVCMISKVDSLSILKFRGAAIVLKTSMVNWSVFSSPGRRRPFKLEK